MSVDAAPASLGRSAPKAALVLEDGRIFRGRAYGAVGVTFGEAVFTTGMTGYQETLTDPSYHRQIVVQTAPHIGNTGLNDVDDESGRMWVAGYVVRDPSRISSNWRAQRTLDDDLIEQAIVGIKGVDTRALTRHLRDRGAMRSGIFSGAAADKSDAELVAAVLATPGMEGADLTAEVTTQHAYTVTPESGARFKVAALDLGMKRSITRLMVERGIEVTVVPATITPEELLAVGADGIFLSNGPGDPATADHAVALTQAALAARRPVFGICFGNQVLGRALGFGTYKLRFGHRGLNQPVQERANGTVAITTHNHGFAVDAPATGSVDTPYGAAQVSHICLNDDVVEGLECLDVPAFSVQYHPEAAAGPHDAQYLFDRFVDLMTASSAKDAS
jgi:carbamoyl-phosphate synthase small subunit